MASNYNRKKFIRDLSLGALALSPVVRGFATKPERKLGLALVGLGGYSSGQLGPALKQTTNCYLAGVVTGTPAKATKWAEQYNLAPENIYNYERFDEIANNKAIDIIYIVLPVAMHKEYTIRAAKAGKHVICEKPMAPSAADCQEMIDACKAAGSLLSIGYRLHYEPNTQEIMRLGQQKIHGAVKEIDCQNGFKWGGPPTWRLKKSLSGGGALMDMGIYAIQGARYSTGEQPIYVTAREEKSDPVLFREVDDTIWFELEFPSGAIAHGKSSYSQNVGYLKVTADKGKFGAEPAYGYGGIRGYTPAGPMDYLQVNQQAKQMDDFAKCVVNKTETRVPGELGRKDLLVIEAIYRSIASGKKEKIMS